jgi:hypothetical protein
MTTSQPLLTPCYGYNTHVCVARSLPFNLTRGIYLPPRAATVQIYKIIPVFIRVRRIQGEPDADFNLCEYRSGQVWHEFERALQLFYRPGELTPC